jgi:hypothetical protein
MTSDGRTYRLFNHHLLQATCSLKDDRMITEASGPMSIVPGVRSALEMIEGQVPALAGEELCISTWTPPVPSVAFQRLAQSQIKATLGIRTPDQVTISITEECPNRCIHCALPDSGRHLRLEPEKVKEIRIDCDYDAILLLVEQKGGACHTGYRSCFYRTVEGKIVGEKIFEPKDVYR